MVHFDPVEERYRDQEKKADASPGAFRFAFPLAVSGSYFQIEPSKFKADVQDDRYKNARAYLNAASIDTSVSPPGEWTLVWNNLKLIKREWSFYEVLYHIEYEIDCYNSKIDERQAQGIKRPDRWSDELQPYLSPERFIESTDEGIARFVRSATGNKAERIKPWFLAKLLAQATVRHVRDRPSPTVMSPKATGARGVRYLAQNVKRGRDGPVGGIQVTGAANLAATRGGTIHDVACLFVAACRACDIPARPVIGVDLVENDHNLTCWAEFYLPELGWVPVDFTRFLSSPGSIRDIQKPWNGFGSHNDLNTMVPLANRFQPFGEFKYPGNYPLFWGTGPEFIPNRAYQQVLIQVSAAGRRLEDMRR